MDELRRKVMFEKWTEPPFSGEYVNFKKEGVYACANCGQILFESSEKFDSGSGWPSFFDAVDDSVEYEDDYSHGTRRIEIKCMNCGIHLGHFFEDGPKNSRYCVNSVCLNFEKR